MTENVFITLAGYLVTVGVALLWVLFSKQGRIPRTFRTAVCLSLRTLPLFVVFFLACELSGVNAIPAIAILGISLWILLMGPADSCLGVAALLYVIQQWILGWPDRSDFVLEPPAPSKDKGAHLDVLIGARGVASCPLRPGGMVTLGGNQYPARSDLGYIERGAPVRVVGRKETSLLVRLAEAQLDDTRPASAKTPGN